MDYTCSAQGVQTWHTATSWIPNGIPGQMDTATIAAGCTMQCETNNVCTLGKAGNPGSTDLYIQAGADLTLLSGSYFDMQGDVTLEGELDIFAGTFVLDPAVATGAVSYYIDGGAASGADTLEICSESTCSSNVGTLGVLTCQQGNSGSCQVRHSSGYGNGMNVLGSHGQISNLGTSSMAGIYLMDGTQPPTGGFVLKNNFSMHANGVVQVEYNSPTLDLTFDGVSFDTMVDTNGSWNGYSFLDLVSTVAPTSGDRTFRVTCANTRTHEAILNIRLVNAAVGDASHPGLISYNCDLTNAALGGTFQNVLNIVDRNTSSGFALATAYNVNALYQDWVMFDHTPNQHHISGTTWNGRGASNSYVRMTFDGDGYSGYDPGDDYQDFGTYSASYGLHINSSGTAFTLGSNSNQSASFDHETIYNSYGGTLCETSCTPTMLQQWSDSLIVFPSQLLGPEYPGNDGMHNERAFNQRQTSNSAATDYNFFWQMPGSGDPGANPAKNTHIQLNLGDTPSWVAITDPMASFLRYQPVNITGGVVVSCSNCFQSAQPNDYVVDVTQQPDQYAVIQTVLDASDAVLYAPIPGWTTGDLVDIRPGYFATNGYYGVDWGTHDQHVAPWFQDQTRTVCSWWQQQSGSPANCNWPNGNNYTAGSGTTSTLITDNAADFGDWGVQDGVDVIFVYNAGWYPRGSGTVLSHTATSLVVTPISGASPGDYFTFITAAQSLGQSAVQAYGFDLNGNPVNPPAWVNPNMAQAIESYLQQGYTPTNLALFGAGGDGKSVGAVEVLPPNGGVTVTSN